MDLSNTYIKMCKEAPRELTQFISYDSRQFAACTYHMCLVEYDEGYHEWQCPQMEAKQRIILGKNVSDKYEQSLWRQLQ